VSYPLLSSFLALGMLFPVVYNPLRENHDVPKEPKRELEADPKDFYKSSRGWELLTFRLPMREKENWKGNR
jgi:hypothetical protein